VIYFEYLVIEHYVDEPPDEFGHVTFAADQQPKVGDVVMLRWLDGRDAYRVRVDRIDNMRLHVMQPRV
jgi:hypothetical protein